MVIQILPYGDGRTETETNIRKKKYEDGLTDTEETVVRRRACGDRRTDTKTRTERDVERPMYRDRCTGTGVQTYRDGRTSNETETATDLRRRMYRETCGDVYGDVHVDTDANTETYLDVIPWDLIFEIQNRIRVESVSNLRRIRINRSWVHT